jgi:hypothetical protein
MDNEQDRQKELVNTTDCLEAISVFKFWKNLIFVLLLISLLVIQVCFWVINLDLCDKTQAEEVKIVDTDKTAQPELIDEAEKVVDEVKDDIQAAAKKVTGDANEPAVAETTKKKTIDFSTIFKKVHFMWTIRTMNFMVILLGMTYCLLNLFALKVSMVGRLGGINHISRALVLSVLFVVVILPWQEIFGWFTAGALYAPGELITHLSRYDSLEMYEKVFFYLRFVGYWFVALILLIFTQSRTCRWSKATLRRLEVV